MIEDQVKICPSCRTPALLRAAYCTQCAHRFRTQFSPPASAFYAPSASSYAPPAPPYTPPPDLSHTPPTPSYRPPAPAFYAPPPPVAALQPRRGMAFRLLAGLLCAAALAALLVLLTPHRQGPPEPPASVPGQPVRPFQFGSP